MRTTFSALAIGILLLGAGCVPALHELFTDKDIVFDPALIGAWKMDSGDMLTFLKSSDQGYDVVYTEKGVPARFEAHLAQLGKFRFLDAYPAELDVNNNFYKMHYVRAHTFSRIWLAGDTLHLALLDPDWLKNQIAADNVSLAHELVDNSIVLTAPTSDLQDFALRYAEDGDAFADSSRLLRQK